MTNAGEGVEQREPSYIVGKNVNGAATVENSYDPASPLPGIYLEKTTIQKNTPQCSIVHYLHHSTI